MKTSIKTCFKCDTDKPLSEFYRHAQMGDGHLNKCKDCTKVDVGQNRQKHLERIREYDRKRGNRQGPEYFAMYYERSPEKKAAHIATGNAIRDGRLKKEPCAICKTVERVEAHHEDYSRPLDVVWLCSAHHKQWHVLRNKFVEMNFLEAF